MSREQNMIILKQEVGQIIPRPLQQADLVEEMKEIVDSYLSQRFPRSMSNKPNYKNLDTDSPI